MKYKAVGFYNDEQPELLNVFLSVLAPKVESFRVINILRRANTSDFGRGGLLPLCKGNFQKAQEAKVTEINEALNKVLIAEGPIEELEVGIEQFTNLDHLMLSRKLQDSKLIQLHHISARLFWRNGTYEQASEVSKKKTLHKNEIESVSVSEDSKLTEKLDFFFYENKVFECFSETL